MRQLATVQKIAELLPIAGADAIECARVLGWELVVKKGQFKVGDLCVYCEIDSVLPAENPHFAFLEGKRIKTVKLRGQISQGIAFGLEVLPPLPEGRECTCADWGMMGCLSTCKSQAYQLGEEVTDALGITKWSPKEPGEPGTNFGKRASTFPEYIPKTDETRVQILQPLLDKFQGTRCYITEKLDGSSITLWRLNGQFHVASRNFEITEGLMWDVAQAYEGFVAEGMCLQGELIGPGVQKNKYKLTSLQIRFFSLFDIERNCYIENEIIVKTPGVWAPLLDDNYILGTSIPDLVKLSIGQSALNPDVKREGIVVRSCDNIGGQRHRHFFGGGRIENAMGMLSFKVINPEFSLRYDE